ncbi:MAG: AsmA-like C-terminal region-containing protein [Thermonemataceae bacterium]|nr:AsmA-like C-terminal region-containing protein [Thermonemataceae bacterium]
MKKKLVKRILIITASTFGLLLLAAIAIPFLFKDKIKAEIDKQIALYVNAKVNFKADDFSLSVFKNFPDVTASLNNLSIINNAPFQNDTLASLPSLQITVDLMSVFGDNMKINKIALEKPRIFAKINKEGKANWDIVRPQPLDTTKKIQDTSSKFSLAIKKWIIEDGYLLYQDKTMNMNVLMQNIRHEGKGDLASDVFDMYSETEIKKFSFSFEGTEYLSQKKIKAEITLGMDLKNFKFTFKENKVLLNDFGLKFDGFVAMPDTNITMDIKYASTSTDFKTLLSLVPGIYTDSFKDIKADGKISFNGDVKGTYNAVQMPAFHLGLLVDKAYFQYPNLPNPVSNINIDLKVGTDDGVIDNMFIDLKKLHLDFGQNPLDAKAYIKGLSKMNIDAKAKTRLNLGEVSKVFPMPDIKLAGIFDLDASAKGIYDGKQMPVLAADMSLSDGYVKSTAFPEPLEKLNLKASAKSDGTLPNSEFALHNFSMLLQGESFFANALIKNFEDINFDIKAKGAIDLTKITKIYPLEGMKLAGRIQGDIASAGKMSDIEKNQYDKIRNSGDVKMSAFVYETKDIPIVKINKAHLQFNPKEMILESLEGMAGKSDFKANGSVSNYLGYVFKNETIKGKFSFNSTKFDVNEWLSDSPTPSTTESSSPMTVVAIPKNIDFLLNTSIGEVIYDNLSLKNMKGDVLVKDGKLSLKDGFFNTLGGDFVMNGVYDTQDEKKPTFDFDFGISDLQITDAAKNFITMKKIAPISESVNGKFSTKFKLAGDLGQDMMPLYNTLSGNGLITVMEGTLQNIPLMNKIADQIKMPELKQAKFADFLTTAQVKNGRFLVEPYDVKVDKYMINVSGSNGIADGSLDYVMKMDVPAEKAGQELNKLVTSQLGVGTSFDKVPLVINIGGTYKNPTIKISVDKNNLKGSVKNIVDTKKDELKNQLKNELDNKKKEAEEKIKAEADKLKKEAEIKAKAEADRLKKEAEERAKAELEKLKNEKLKKQADSLKKLAEDKLKNKIKVPIKIKP